MGFKDQRRLHKERARLNREARAAERQARIAKKYVRPAFKPLRGYLAGPGAIIDREREEFPSHDPLQPVAGGS